MAAVKNWSIWSNIIKMMFTEEKRYWNFSRGYLNPALNNSAQ